MFNFVGPPVYLVFGDHNYTNFTIQDEISRMEDQLMLSPWTQDNMHSWLDDFVYLFLLAMNLTGTKCVVCSSSQRVR